MRQVAVVFCGRRMGFIPPATPALITHLSTMGGVDDGRAPVASLRRPPSDHGQCVLSLDHCHAQVFRLVLTRNDAHDGAGQTFFVTSSTGGRAPPRVVASRLWFSDDTLFDGTVFEGQLMQMVDQSQEQHQSQHFQSPPWVFVITDLLRLRGTDLRKSVCRLQARTNMAIKILSAHHEPDDHDVCLLRVQAMSEISIEYLQLSQRRESKLQPSNLSLLVDDMKRPLSACYPVPIFLRVRTLDGEFLATVLLAEGKERSGQVPLPAIASHVARPGVANTTNYTMLASPPPPPPLPLPPQSVTILREVMLWAHPTTLPDVYELTETRMYTPLVIGVVHAHIASMDMSEAMMKATCKGAVRMKFTLHVDEKKWVPML